MDTSAFFDVGQQLHDFLVQECSPPPGAKTVLGFLGTGVAVEPDSFLSQGKFNPARINAWLDVVIDPLASIIGGDDRIDAAPMTASELMQAICLEATSSAPAGTDDQRGFAKIKSLAMENLGGGCTVSTVPFDWYDPAQVPQWRTKSLTTSTTQKNSTGTGDPPQTPTRPPLWAWRTLQKVQIRKQLFNDDEVSSAELPRVSARRTFAATSMVAAPSSNLSATVAIAPAARFVQAAEVTEQSRIVAVDRAPIAMAVENAPAISNALMVSQAISASANAASTSSVISSSLTLNLSYRVVQLSRKPWWNDLLPLLDNWYIPNLQRASLVREPTTQSVIGVPIALILTDNVEIRANWSASDRAAVQTSTHVGPWAINSNQFTATSSSGEATLTIPGMTAIACMYQALPALPPKSDPSRS